MIVIHTFPLLKYGLIFLYFGLMDGKRSSMDKFEVVWTTQGRVVLLNRIECEFCSGKFMIVSVTFKKEVTEESLGWVYH